MRPGRLLYLLRRELNRGPAGAWAYHVLRRRIWHWRNPQPDAPPADIPVHVVFGAEHVDLLAWMLASWTVQTGRNWHVILHDDGTAPADIAARLRTLGLQATLVSRSGADAHLAPVLAARPLCRAYRAQYPLGLKCFDIPVLETASRLIILDPDVLFFRQPTQVLEWVDRAQEESCWFNEDVAEASNVSAQEAQDTLGVQLWPRVNSGLCLLTRAAMDLDFCECAMRETSLRTGHFWRVEQTLFALAASRHARGGLLPVTYEVSLRRHARSDAISRHYVGAVRERFWAEGVRHLIHLPGLR
ncbi:hypothetical protein [Opitutus sp. ER46]|uniref:hypothetical protein n=1 Tax=Opitutus sp. ER46 TaxID=2161864 RepID=UPI000D3106CE|nr:hypothetical protein [Opitutus sp. ER46]PTX91104.1 hypothetical protein DB354_20940 [Opitutus sp. ER46]